jgi:hypothetical protein
LPAAPGKASLCAAAGGEHLALSLLNLQPHDGMLLVTSRDQIARACPAAVSTLAPTASVAARRHSQASGVR